MMPEAAPLVVMRVDASTRIGTGHVTRCLTLADELAERGATVEFVCRTMAGDLTEMIGDRGYQVRRLPQGSGAPASATDRTAHAAWLETDWRTDAEQTVATLASAAQRPAWLVVDHYALDVRWEVHLRPVVGRILAIDDLADRPHAADILLDQNYAGTDDRYTKLVPEPGRILQGPRFALVDGAYRDARANLAPRVGRCARWILFFGGVDLTNESVRALTAVARSRWRTMPLDVVVGAGNPHRDAVADAVLRLPRATLHVQVPNLAGLFAASDLAIGAGGTAIWERCCVGVPSVLVATAVNQVPTLEALAADGCVAYLGPGDRVTVDDYLLAFGIAGDRPRLAELSRRCMMLVDGRGADRVADAMGIVDPAGAETVTPV